MYKSKILKFLTYGVSQHCSQTTNKFTALSFGTFIYFIYLFRTSVACRLPKIHENNN